MLRERGWIDPAAHPRRWQLQRKSVKAEFPVQRLPQRAYDGRVRASSLSMAKDYSNLRPLAIEVFDDYRLDTELDDPILAVDDLSLPGIPGPTLAIT